jgi:hypothetical protein
VIESAIPRTHGKATGQTNEQQQKAFRAYKDALSELMNHEGSRTMTKFDPELVQVMRAALEEIMQRVPVEYATPATKAYLAECILKAAAQGQTSFDALLSAAADHIPIITSLLS